MAHLTSYPDQKAHQRYFVVKSESLYIRTSPVRDDQHQKQSMISKAMHDRVIDLLTIRIANWNLRKALANTREFLTKHWVHVWHVKWYGFGMSFTYSLKFFLTTINKGISTLDEENPKLHETKQSNTRDRKCPSFWHERENSVLFFSRQSMGAKWDKI